MLAVFFHTALGVQTLAVPRPGDAHAGRHGYRPPASSWVMACAVLVIKRERCPIAAWRATAWSARASARDDRRL
jgi:hypothetical protein